jgi:glucokinase
MLIAADVGGTNTRLGLFTVEERRPRPVIIRGYDTRQFANFDDILTSFLETIGSERIDAAAFGVAGPVVHQRARLTNVAWELTAAGVAQRFGIARTRLINDLEAMAASIPALDATELETLQAGSANPDGNLAVLAAGTGLGEAYLPRVNGRLQVLASEAGHADYAARTDRELELVRFLRGEFGRASVEHVLSGRGLLNLHRFTHLNERCTAAAELLTPAHVSLAGLEELCEHCREALLMFVDALGAEAGNLGLRGTATAGVYVGGGIAPRILPALRDGRFLRAFLDKAPMEALVASMPVHIILNTDAGLLGAAVVAEALLH